MLSLFELFSFPARRSSDLAAVGREQPMQRTGARLLAHRRRRPLAVRTDERITAVHRARERHVDEAKALRCHAVVRSEEHTSELQSRFDIVCRLRFDKKKRL